MVYNCVIIVACFNCECLYCGVFYSIYVFPLFLCLFFFSFFPLICTQIVRTLSKSVHSSSFLFVDYPQVVTQKAGKKIIQQAKRRPRMKSLFSNFLLCYFVSKIIITCSLIISFSHFFYLFSYTLIYAYTYFRTTHIQLEHIHTPTHPPPLPHTHKKSHRLRHIIWNIHATIHAFVCYIYFILSNNPQCIYCLTTR